MLDRLVTVEGAATEAEFFRGPGGNYFLALEGAELFDPMGNGRVRSDKVMLPEAMMSDPTELRRWIARAFKSAASLPAKDEKSKTTTTKTKKKTR